MNKIYTTLLALSLAGSATAMELTFYIGDKAVTNEATEYFSGIEKEDYGDYFEVKMDPKLSLGTDTYSSAIRITAECTSGQSIQMCAGGQCEGGKTVVKDGVRIQAGEKLNLRFDYVGELDNGDPIPTVTTHFEAVVPEYPETRREFVLVMSETGAGVADIDANGGDTVALTQVGLYYNLAAPSDATLYDICGKCVVNTKVSGEGVLSLAGLHKGIYIYRIASKTGKIIVK